MISDYKQCQILLNKMCKGTHSSLHQCSLPLYICFLNAGCVCSPALLQLSKQGIWHRYSWEWLLSLACLQSPGVCRKDRRSNLFCVFLGKPASSRPLLDPISAWIHRRHPSLSLLPLCGHTKTLFVLPLLALLQTYHHPNAQPRATKEGGDKRNDRGRECERTYKNLTRRETYADIKISQVMSVVNIHHNVLNAAFCATSVSP